MKKILIIVISLCILTACGNGYQTIESNQAKSLIENGATIIDVRTSEEYQEGHIENAINIPVDRINEVTSSKDTTIIVYCASGVRSAQAAKVLKDAGYEKVYNLDGGLINWGFETVK